MTTSDRNCFALMVGVVIVLGAYDPSSCLGWLPMPDCPVLGPNEVAWVGLAGSRLVAVGVDGTVRMWDVQSGMASHPFIDLRIPNVT